MFLGSGTWRACARTQSGLLRKGRRDRLSIVSSTLAYQATFVQSHSQDIPRSEVTVQ